MGGDIIKTLKSDSDTRDIPVLLIEAYFDIEQLAEGCGADAYLQVPRADPQELQDAIRALIGENAGAGDSRESAG